MEFGPFLPFGAPKNLKNAVAHLTGLEEKELTAVNEELAGLDVPINRRKIRASGGRLHSRISRLSEDQWENIVSLVLQLLSVRDLVELLEDMGVVDDESQAKLTQVLAVF